MFLGVCYASVVELVYTSDLKSDGLTAMRVQVPPLAPRIALYTQHISLHRKTTLLLRIL